MLRNLLALLLFAGAVSAAHAVEAAIRRAVEKLLGPDVKVEGVAKAGVLGLYEVRLATEEGARIVYIDENADYFFIGNIYDNKTQTDLTDARMRKLNAIRFAPPLVLSRDQADAIVAIFDEALGAVSAT